MAWFDLLGGLAQGLGSGLNQVQQNVEAQRRSSVQDRELALRALQEQRAAEDQARAAAYQKWQAMQDGVEFDAQDPEIQGVLKHVGPTAFIKGASGRGLMKRPDLQRQKTELELDEMRKNVPVADMSRTTALANAKAREATERSLAKKYGDDWRANVMGLPPNARQAAAALIYEKPDLFQKPGEHPQVLAAGLNADAMRDYNRARAETIPIDDMARLQQLFIAEKKDLDRLAVARYIEDPSLLQKEFDQWMEQRRQMGAAPAPIQLGKYTVSQ